jgi:hypothetical protein
MSEGQSGTYCTLRNWLVELPLESAAANDGELGKRLEKWTRQEMGKEGWIGEGEEEESEMGSTQRRKKGLPANGLGDNKCVASEAPPLSVVPSKWRGKLDGLAHLGPLSIVSAWVRYSDPAKARCEARLRKTTTTAKWRRRGG